MLRGVDLVVPKGSITCIVGPNGAGKSTLLATVSGMLKPRQGKIMFDGRDLVGCSPKEILSAGIVLVPQNHSLFRHMTVRENVELGAFTIRRQGPRPAAPKGGRGHFPDSGRARPKKRPACPGASSGWWSSPEA